VFVQQSLPQQGVFLVAMCRRRTRGPTKPAWPVSRRVAAHVATRAGLRRWLSSEASFKFEGNPKRRLSSRAGAPISRNALILGRFHRCADSTPGRFRNQLQTGQLFHLVFSIEDEHDVTSR
jgi:hypothetical protein